MTRIDLNVPFSEKDEAKQLGARWDTSLKVWFVPTGTDPSPFRRWMESAADVSIKAENYSIAQAVAACWKCRKLTRVYGFLLIDGCQSVDPDDDNEWNEQDSAVMVLYVTDLPPAVVARIKLITPHYYPDFSKTTKSSYWMNHCEHCGMKQGDFTLYCEPGGAFSPEDDYAASSIELEDVKEPFGCNGSISYNRLFGDM